MSTQSKLNHFNESWILAKEKLSIHVLNHSHLETLAQLASEKEIWQFAPHTFYQKETFEEKWFGDAMHTKQRITFVIAYENNIKGSSSYYEIDSENRRLNIGYTWFHPSAWGTKINPLSKLLMLEYAFENLNFNRVAFVVDSLNIRSCHAVKKLAIKQEGILRNHMVLPNGRIRHSVIFSVIKEEWPEVKKHIVNLCQL